MTRSREVLAKVRNARYDFSNTITYMFPDSPGISICLSTLPTPWAIAQYAGFGSRLLLRLIDGHDLVFHLLMRQDFWL